MSTVFFSQGKRFCCSDRKSYVFQSMGALFFIIYLAIAISYLYHSYGHYLPDFGNGTEVAVTIDLNHS